MSDALCSSKAYFSSLLISDLILFCSFIFSNPLYLSYFIFFSPYLLRLISFLSPLLITTFLIFFAFLTAIARENFSTDFGFTSPSDLENPRPEKYYCQDEGFLDLDYLGMYEILFGTCLMNCVNENPLEISEKKSEENRESGSDKEKDSSFGKTENFGAKKLEEKNPGHVSELKNSCPEMEERRLENFLKILNQFERMSTGNYVEEKKKIGRRIDRAAAAVEGVRDNAATKICSNISSNGGTLHNPLVRAHSQRIISSNADNIDGNEKEQNYLKVIVEGVRNNAATKISANISSNGGRLHNPLVKAHSQRIISSNVDNVDGNEKEHNYLKFGSFGSMRKEKEWKRTLACKLFEERHNVGGGEGMDSLWEAYELNSDKKRRDEKKSEIEFNEDCYGNEEEDEEDDEGGEEVVDGQLCCLQAIKFSAGKMNLGVRRPNLVKISKAIKGFGWLHHVSKHSKKVHNNGDKDRY